MDPTRTIVNDGTRVTDDSYYYKWADVTADLQALATAGNLNGSYQVNNIYNDGGAGWKFTSGWALVVVYENPKLGENRVINIRSGFQRVGAGAATTSADNNVFASGYLKPPGTWEVFGQVTLGGEPNVSGDHFKVNASDIGYNGRAGNNFFNGTTTINNDAPQVNNRGWDVSYFGNNTYVPAGATNLNTVYEANNGGYDAFIKIVNAVSAVTAQPTYQIETKVLNTANADIAGQRIALDTEAKYQINMRNVGHGLPTALKLEALLPQNLSYVGIEGALPAGVSAPTSTNVGGRTMLTFNMTPGALPNGASDFKTITIKVKTTNDCNALRDACSNRLSIQPKLVYTVTNPTDNQEKLSHKKLADCAPAATTFYIEDTPCGQASRNTLPYCASFELDGGAGYTSYKWTKQGQGVVSTSQRYQVNAAGTYVLERTGGPADCANVSTKTYIIQPRTGNDALHPLRNSPKVVERQTCNNTGLEYLQVALCGAYVDLAATGTGLPDDKVEWYKYTGSTSQLVASCPPASVGVEPANWRKIGTGNTFRLQAAEVHNNGTHFAIVLKHPSGCNLDYYFRAYKSEMTYSLNKENIMPLNCGSGAGARGWLKVSGIPDTNYQYKVDGPSNSIGWTDVPGQSFEREVTVAGRYKVTLRPKLAPGASQYQNNVCNFENTIDVEATTSTNTNPNFTLSKTDVLCVGTDPATGILNVRLSNQITLPVYVTVTKQGGGQVVKYLANTEALRSSENLTGTDLTKLRTLGKGTYEVTIQPQSRTQCTSPARTIEIKEVPQLKILNTTYKDPTCGPTKQITVSYQGGTPPYTVKISGSDNISVNLNNGTLLNATINFDDPRFTPAVGTKNYTVEVIDSNSCTVSRAVVYKLQAQPIFTHTSTPADCAPNAGTIKMTLNNPQFDPARYTVQYAIQKQVGNSYPTTDTWIKQSYPNGTFTGLTAGKYRLRVYYTRAGVTCSYPAESYQTLNNGRLEYLN